MDQSYANGHYAHQQRPSNAVDLEIGSVVGSTEKKQSTIYMPRFMGWSIKNVDWAFVFASQHWATLAWIIIFLVALAISHWEQSVTSRPFLNYDASISYINPKTHHGKGDTIPTNASWLPPFGVLIVNLVLYEFFLNRRLNRTVSHALATLIHFLMDAICAFCCMRFIVEVTKLAAGRLRPDFLQDCYGLDGLSSQTLTLGFANGSSAACTTDNADSRKSLPSGHASGAMVTMIYSIVYSLWTIYFRDREGSFSSLNIQEGWRGSFGKRFMKEFWHSAFLVWNVAQFGFGWAVGITRFTDNKHNVSDIIAGWYIATIIALIFVVRAIGTHRYVTFTAV